MTSLASNEVAEYARVVRAALVDLPADSARAILDGLDEHLAEVAAEGSVDLEATLGPPAAYAAELRASAGFPPLAASDEPVIDAAAAGSPATLHRSPDTGSERDAPITRNDAQPEPEDADPTERRLHAGRSRDVTIARGVLLLTLSLVAVVVIRASEPLGALEIVALTAGVVAAWWGITEFGRRAALTGWWQRRFPTVVAVGAVAAATWLGGQFGGGTEYVWVDDADATTSENTDGVPYLSGFLVAEARAVLQEQGFTVRTVDAATGMDLGLGGDAEQFSVVEWIAPGPGTMLAAGQVITLGVVMVDGTSVVPIAPMTTVLAVTTVAPPIEPTTTTTPPPMQVSTLVPTTVTVRDDQVDVTAAAPPIGAPSTAPTTSTTLTP